MRFGLRPGGRLPIIRHQLRPIFIIPGAVQRHVRLQRACLANRRDGGKIMGERVRVSGADMGDWAFEHRRELRRRATKPEQLLWWALRKRRQDGLKFRRQHSIGPFIVDFVCLEKKLVVELEGDYHDYFVEKDERRQRYLEAQGFRVIRFLNEEVLDDLEAVALAIVRSARTPSP